MLELGYVLLTILVAFLISMGYKSVISKIYADPEVRRKKLLSLLVPLGMWLLYIFLIGKSGFLQNYDLPPRFPILLIMPCFLFTGIFLYRNRNSALIHETPKHWPVYFQSFRIIVETLFVFTIAKGMLHPNLTIEGYNMDMLMGLSAPIVGYLVFHRKALSPKVALWWNYLGLGVLASVVCLFVTHVYFPSVWGSAVPLVPTEFGAFPYVLVPGFLMPAAVFFHIFSIIQLRRTVDG